MANPAGGVGLSGRMKKPDITKPEWADCRGITRIYGIGKSSLYRLEAEGKIKSASLKGRGKVRGKKLWSCASVAAYIENCSTGGEVAQ